MRLPAPVFVNPKSVPEITEEISEVPAILKVPFCPSARMSLPVPPLLFGPMILKVLPEAAYSKSVEVPETPLPRFPAPPKVSVLFVEPVVLFRIEYVPLGAVTLKEPTVRLFAVSALIPVPTAELKTASLVTVGTVPKLQLPAVPRGPVGVPVQVFAVFCASAAGLVAAAA